LLLPQPVPPVVASDNRLVPPSHTVVRPDIAAGNALTVMLAVLEQPVAGNR
jgi:hypothetical protein